MQARGAAAYFKWPRSGGGNLEMFFKKPEAGKRKSGKDGGAA
jgi:hypothetical protein